MASMAGGVVEKPDDNTMTMRSPAFTISGPSAFPQMEMYSPVGNSPPLTIGKVTVEVRDVGAYAFAGIWVPEPAPGERWMVKMYGHAVCAVFGTKCASTLTCKLSNVPFVGTVNAM